MTDTDAEVLGAIRGIAGFEATPEGAGVTRLGGLTNRVYRVEAPGGPVVVRLPGPGTEAYIDRVVEAENARGAARAGVSPEVLGVDPGSGVMVTRFVGGRTMTEGLFRSVEGAAGRAGAVFRELHGSGVEFSFRFELFAMIDEYLRVLGPMGVAVPEGYREVVERAQGLRGVLGEGEALRPCHCDPLCENFIDAGTRMWLVDWEYSGMNDPVWDLADLSVEAGFDAGQEREMLEAYCGGAVPVRVGARMVALKAMVDLLWTLWGLIQHGNGNPVEDFMAYATNRFERCKALMRHDNFAEQVAVLRRP